MKFLFGIALALGISATAYAAAATLNVTGGALQQGNDANLKCDTDGVTIHYNTTAIDGEMRLQKVFVDGLDATCAGGEMDVILKNSGTQIWFGAADIPANFPGGTLQAGTAGSTNPDVTTISITDVTEVLVAVYDTYP